MVLPNRWESRSSPNTTALQVTGGLFCFKSRETRNAQRDLLLARAGKFCVTCQAGPNPARARGSRRGELLFALTSFHLLIVSSPHRLIVSSSLHHPLQNQKSRTPPWIRPENHILGAILICCWKSTDYKFLILDDPPSNIFNVSHFGHRFLSAIFPVFFQTPPKQRHFQLLFLSGIRKIIF